MIDNSQYIIIDIDKKLEKKLFDIDLKNDSQSVINSLRERIDSKIYKTLQINSVKYDVSNFNISSKNNIVQNILVDQRNVIEKKETNRTGKDYTRTLDKSKINLQEYSRENYNYKMSSVKEFEIPDSKETESCNSCKGQGQNMCDSCNGAGTERCDSCRGGGQIRCRSCSGKGQTSCMFCWGKGYNSEGKRCFVCSGRGYNICSSCQNGYYTCNSCSGKGIVSCFSCSGTSFLTCYNCSGYKSFVYRYVVESNIRYIKSNSLKISNVSNLISILIDSEEFNYSRTFKDYELKKFEKYKSEIKNLFLSEKFKGHEFPQKIRFEQYHSLDVKFEISYFNSTYLCGISSNGIYIEKSFIDNLLINLITNLNIDENFDELLSIKKPLINSIPLFDEIFKDINSYKKFNEIINSKNTAETKIENVKKIKNIESNLFKEDLRKSINKKYIKTLLITTAPVCAIISFLFYSYSPYIILIFISINILTFLITNEHIFNDTKNSLNIKNVFSNTIILTSLSLVGLFFYGYANDFVTPINIKSETEINSTTSSIKKEVENIQEDENNNYFVAEIDVIDKIENEIKQVTNLNQKKENPDTIESSKSEKKEEIKDEEIKTVINGYNGEILNGRRNGYGEMIYTNGDTYLGYWKDDKHEGTGTYTYFNGDKYVGNFNNNLKNGNGTFYYYKSKSRFQGVWENNIQKNGTLFFNNGDYFKGDIDIPGEELNGYGIYTWRNGDYYEGSFKFGKKNGEGKYYWSDGASFKGRWLNDKENGPGLMIWSDGGSYRGNYINGLRSGKGIHRYVDGKVYEEEWFKGELISERRRRNLEKRN